MVSYFSTDDVFFPQPSPPVTIARKIGLTPYNPKLWFTDSANTRRVSINAWQKEFTPRIRGRVSINAWQKEFTPRFRGGLVFVWQDYLVMLYPIYWMCSECLGSMTSQLLWFQAQWTVVAVGCKYPLCDYSNVVSFGHNELWLLQPQIASLWPLKCCGVRPQRTVAAQDRKNGH